MNTSPTPRKLSIWLFAALLGAVLTIAPASASVIDEQPIAAFDTAIDEPAAASLDAEPSAGGISVFSLSQCGSGYFCVWSEPNYQGAIKRFSNQSQYTSIGLNYIGSFYNNRSKRVYLYGNPSGTPSACYGAQAKRATTSGWLAAPKGTYLSTATSC